MEQHGKVAVKARKSWITEEIIKLMENRRLVKSRGTERSNAQHGRKSSRLKKWLYPQCDEI